MNSFIVDIFVIVILGKLWIIVSILGGFLKGVFFIEVVLSCFL